tara:strand:- start:801 stop:1448 length:648 start_codon:yes stop_codon:yes gene_type:complete
MSNAAFPYGGGRGLPDLDGPNDWRNPKDPPKGNGLPIPGRAPTLNLEQTCPGIVNLFILSQENDGTLTNANLALKRNLKNYLLDLKMLTDKVIIRNAFVINISLEFEIVAQSDYNSQEVLLNTIDHLKEHFKIEHWQIGQALSLADVRRVIYDTAGVQNINSIKIRNECDTALGYNSNFYDIDGATFEEVIYPSIDPSIFEIKFPNKDIKGTVRN